MWSSTTNATSDNLKKEEVEPDNCSCSSGSSGNSVALTPKRQEKQNTFEPIRKKELSPFGDDEDIFKEPKDREFCNETGVDSGFISGPQTAELDQEQETSKPYLVANIGEINQKEGSSNVQKYNILGTESVNKQQQKQEQLKKVLDSGCIDIDDLQEGSVEQESVEQKQSPKESSVNNAGQMILKHNVDAGMSEWFCNLSLQTDSTNIQQQPPPTISLNNLNYSAKKISSIISTPATVNDGKSNKQSSIQQSSGAQTIGTTASAAWEQFYQQNDDGDTPLHLACISGYVDVVAALIRMAPHPCLFNIQNDEAQTALHLAALTAQPKILRMLLIAGAEPTIRDRHGNTALHLACISGEEQCVRALIIPISASEINEAHRQYGHRSNDKTVSYLSCARLPSDLEIRNYEGERCVHLASQSGHIDILRILVLYGADINAREGKSGRTPLHIAIECCNEDLANFLLDECQKLNLEAATYAGLTAYQVACLLNKSQMQNMLERRGAEPLTPPDSDYESSDIEDLDESKIYDRFGDPGYFTTNYNGNNPMTVA